LQVNRPIAVRRLARTWGDHARGLVAMLLLASAACSLEAGGAGPAESGNTDDDNGGGTDNGNDDVTNDDGDPHDGGMVIVGRDGSIDMPTTDGPCMPGHYEGTYTCTYKNTGPFGISTSVVMGTLTFDLEAANKAAEFNVINGVFNANPTALQTITAVINGTLKCGQPFQGKLVRGMASGLLQIGTTSFEATLLATYDTDDKAFVDATMSIPAMSGNSGCDGTWDAKYSATR